MKALYMSAAAILLATTAPTFADSFDTIFCARQNDAEAVKAAVMAEPSLEHGANNAVALAVVEPLLAGGACETREFVDLEIDSAGFYTHADGIRVAVVAVDNGYAVAVDFPGI